MKTRNSIVRLFIVISLLASLPNLLLARTLTARTARQNKEASIAKVIQLLQDSGLTHRKTGESTWVIERPGKNPMLVATGTEFLVLGIIVAVKKNMRVSNELNFRLLKLNHSLDYVKVGFDDDDDLFVRTELRIRTVDLEAFKATVADVNAGADRARETVTPFLITP